MGCLALNFYFIEKLISIGISSTAKAQPFRDGALNRQAVILSVPFTNSNRFPPVQTPLPHLHSSCQQTPNSTVLCKLSLFPRPDTFITSTTTDISILSSDLLRRLPPHATSLNLQRLCALTPHLTEDLLSAVDQPLETRRCSQTGRDYLCCDYNRDGDSWRSPWSNEFEPKLEEGEEGTKPSERVRRMEVSMGDAMDVYREL